MQYGLIGEHLPHSFSREVHAKIGDYAYELCELRPEEVADFIKARDFLGINVTIPYKQTVMPMLDGIDPAAAEIGAVNTVVNRDGKLYGYNTDIDGMRACLAHYGISLCGETVLLLGNGGTSHTARALAKAEGAKEILITDLRGGEGVIGYDEVYRRAEEITVILNTTPVGMYPKVNASAVDLAKFPNLSGVFDAVYNPLRTDLILTARKMGIPAGGGLYMLVAQAVYAAAHFRGIQPSADLIESIYYRMRAEKENLVLIGMPGCGKSTVGAKLAAELDRPFFDSDEEIVRRDGRDIPTIFREEGEPVFRDKESEAVAALALESGRVIATGGGAILREENLHALRRTGRLLFLDRPLAQICPTDDRPTASDRAALEKRYTERYPIYRAVADCRIDASLGVAVVTEAAKAAFLAGEGKGETT